MADDDQTVPWDDSTDVFVRDMESEINDKYKVSLRELLSDPRKYQDLVGVSDIVEKIRGDVESYFTDLLSGLQTEEEEFTKQLEGIDALHTQIGQAISSKAGIGRVPFVKPASLDAGDQPVETIYLDNYDGQADMLVTKLINSSSYILDLSTSYRKYAIGNWFFSGSKNCLLSVQMPDSRILMVENSRDTIMAALDDATEFFATG